MPALACLVLAGSLLRAAPLRNETPLTTAPAGPLTVVLAHRDSPYRSLAQQIAALESIPVVESLTEALTLEPAFLLWVVAPTELSDVAVTAFNRTLERASPRPAAGLITASTVARARGLYERARVARGDRTATVLGEDVFTAAALVVETTADRRQSRPLARTADILGFLTNVDYVHYSGHGGNGYWRPVPNERFAAHDVPRLGPVIVSTMACQTTRMWEGGSIALRMVDEGAAAYSGFYYSPMAGFQIGEEDGPFRYSWPQVPIGYVIEAMNVGAGKGYARTPFHLLLGDPRIALREQPPCRLLDHGESDGVRRVSCSDAPAGLVPLRIWGGARYAFVEIPGVTAVWRQEPFYNRRVQMAPIGEDLIVLVAHRGGDVRMALRRRPPLAWLAVDPLRDALDDLLVSKADRRHGGDAIALFLAAVAATGTVLRVRRKQLGRAHMAAAGALGVVAGLLHAAYALARQPDVVVVAKDLVFSPLAAVGTGVLAACGALLFQAAASWRGRLLGLVTATSVGWIGGLIAVVMVSMTNSVIAARTGIGVWIYRADLHPFILSALGCGLYALVFLAAARLTGKAPIDCSGR